MPTTMPFVCCRAFLSAASTTDIISKTHILNRLSRLLDTPPPAALEPPPSLSLSAEPIANTERYDDLRGNHYVG